MKVIDTVIPGVKIIEPHIIHDQRGYFCETFVEKEFQRLTGCDVRFVQDNESYSRYGVVRGLHFQASPMCQAKLVRVLSGTVVDYAVDLRKGSPAYGMHVSVTLSGDNHLQLFLPHGVAHGFAVLSEKALFTYKCDNYYSPAHEGGINIFDPALGITLPFGDTEAITSPKDKLLPLIEDFDSPFKF